MFKIFRDLSAGANLEALAHSKISRVLLGKHFRKAGSIYLSLYSVLRQNWGAWCFPQQLSRQGVESKQEQPGIVAYSNLTQAFEYQSLRSEERILNIISCQQFSTLVLTELFSVLPNLILAVLRWVQHHIVETGPTQDPGRSRLMVQVRRI